ncbi:PREDICTED: uridine diphosphate glucose pyrophosphatase, partial [Myotis davidii]|uniref:uridine diphosphate glucose pyrophosphatase n=1 Tax=Myotis davidii TaxID=225400 RepID=UPI000767D642
PPPCLFQNGIQKSWDFMKTHDSVTILLFNSSRRSLVLVKQFRPAVYMSEVEPPGHTVVGWAPRPSVSSPQASLGLGRCGWWPVSCLPRGSDPTPSSRLWRVTPALSAWTTASSSGGVGPGRVALTAGCLLRLPSTGDGRVPSGEGCGLLCGSDCAVSTHRAGVGLTGSSQTMFYAEVTDAQRGGPGGGLAEEGELIEVVHLPLGGAQAFSDNPDVPKTLGVIFGISWFLHCVGPGLGLL